MPGRMGMGTLGNGEIICGNTLSTNYLPVDVRKANLSSVTGVFNGAPFSAQSGISSFKDLSNVVDLNLTSMKPL